MQSREIIAKLLEMAAPTAKIKSRLYYHGTTKSGYAEDIIENGIEPGNIEFDQGHQMTPVKGKVYITPHIGYGQIYAIGGNVAGLDHWKAKKPGEMFGWLFVIDGNHLKDIQPDEDQVGELAYFLKDPKHLEPSIYSPWDEETKGKLRNNPALRHELKSFLKKQMSYDQYRKSEEGEVAFHASGGKRALKTMPDELKQRIADMGTNLAHTGKIHPIEAWRIDLFDSNKLKKDGSNFFQIAKQIV